MNLLPRRQFLQKSLQIPAAYLLGLRLPALPQRDLKPQAEVPEGTQLFTLDLETPRIIIEGDGSETDLELTSGGAFIIENGVAKTLQGSTKLDDPWYFANKDDEDLVKREMPQIVFRAVTPEISEAWANYNMEMVITPTKHVTSDSPEVDGTDGIDLFLNYHDQYNLYVAYLTKDGRMMIKRKSVPEGKTEDDAIYSLMAEKQVFDNARTYKTNDNFITPFAGATFDFNASVQNLENGSVEIILQVDIYDPEGTLTFTDRIAGLDDGSLADEDGSGLLAGKPNSNGRAGIRLDSIEAIIEKFEVTARNPFHNPGIKVQD